MSYKNVGVHSSQVGEIKYVQFILQLIKHFLMEWLCKDTGYLIFGANALYTNIILLSMCLVLEC
jgi:hypothetical protein